MRWLRLCGNNNYLGEKLLGVKTQELFYLDPPGRAAIFSLWQGALPGAGMKVLELE